MEDYVETSHVGKVKVMESPIQKEAMLGILDEINQERIILKANAKMELVREGFLIKFGFKKENCI